MSITTHRVVSHGVASRRGIPVRPSPQRERSSRVLFSCFRLARNCITVTHIHTQRYDETHGEWERERERRRGTATCRIADFSHARTCVHACTYILPLRCIKIRSSPGRFVRDTLQQRATQTSYNSLKCISGVFQIGEHLASTFATAYLCDFTAFGARRCRTRITVSRKIILQR